MKVCQSLHVSYQKIIIVLYTILFHHLSHTAVAQEKSDKTTTASAVDDKKCSKLVAAGKCLSDIDYMTKNCRLECREWKHKKYKFTPISLLNQKQSFFDLHATNSTKSNINFNQFEGYVTFILPLAKLCSNQNSVSSKIIFDKIERIQKIYTYSVHILVFPYEHPTQNYNDSNCDANEFDQLTLKDRKGVHVMELSKSLDGDDANLVFQYLKNAMVADMDNDDEKKSFSFIGMNTQIYFIVRPNGDFFEFHYGKSLEDMNDELRHLVKSLDEL
mmetsp:Transcript_3349/g.3859  ORF Transcript_3349/g.3859 Transcript_3349/m.3859 type:complete len:273 (-) Transcript_3349:165-983(-)